MSHHVLSGLKNINDGTHDWANSTLKSVLLMSNTTADTENAGIDNVVDYTTLDECDDTGYARVTLTNVAVTVDEANTRVEVDCDDVTHANNGDATRGIVGELIVIHVDGTAANDIPLLYRDLTATLDGNDLVIQQNAEGISHDQNAA